MRNRFRTSEQQIRINTQFNDDMAELKTQVLFMGQALGSMMELLDGVVGKLSQRRVLSEDEDLLRRYRKSIGILRRAGLRLEPPDDPEAELRQLTCPGCQAVLKARAGQVIERCDWCGHVFEEVC